jgi:hypothetical protein
MIYRFKSKAAGDVIMMRPSGENVLRIIGKEPSTQGIIEARALPAAMKALEDAIAAEDAARRDAAADAPGEGSGPVDKISLRQRAWPLLEMMRRSQRENVDIVWGV